MPQKEAPLHGTVGLLAQLPFRALDFGSFSHAVSYVVRQRVASSAALFQALLSLHIDISYLYNVLNTSVAILEVLGGGGEACAHLPAARQVTSAGHFDPEALEQPCSILASGISSSGDGSGELEPGIPERRRVTHHVPEGNRRDDCSYARAATAGCPWQMAQCPFRSQHALEGHAELLWPPQRQGSASRCVISPGTVCGLYPGQLNKAVDVSCAEACLCLCGQGGRCGGVCAVPVGFGVWPLQRWFSG